MQLTHHAMLDSLSSDANNNSLNHYNCDWGFGCLWHHSNFSATHLKVSGLMNRQTLATTQSDKKSEY